MTPGSPERQLELFDVANQSVSRPRFDLPGRIILQCRHDQLVLWGIGVLVGVTVVFATGVERGKRLARSEHRMLARELPSMEAATPGASAKAPKASPAPQAGVEVKPAPVVVPKAVKKQPSKVVAEPAGKSKSRYAIQVVTYRQPQLAKKEMDRLKARGEPAFLVMREGRTIVFVGPFHTRDNASQKVVSLRSHYQDCFVKTL